MDTHVKSAIFEKELAALKREQAFGPNYVKKSFDLAVAAEMYQGAVEKLRPTAHLETSSQGEIIPPRTLGMSGLELALKEPDLLDAEVTIKRSVLAEKAGVFEMAFETAQSVKAKNSIQRMQAHQLAAAHKYAMELMADASRQRDPIFKVKLMNCSARLMETYSKGALALQRLQQGASQIVQVQHVQVNGQAVIGNVGGRQ